MDDYSESNHQGEMIEEPDTPSKGQSLNTDEKSVDASSPDSLVPKKTKNKGMGKGKYKVPSQKELLDRRTTRAATTMARHHQLARDVRKNRQAELDRINMAMLGKLSPGMKQAAFLYRRRQMLSELLKDSLF